MSVDSFKLALPVQGCEAKDWVANYFVAHEKPGQPGKFEDYRGGEKTYCGHEGTDFSVPNFRWMDQGFAVYASANGKVICVHDGEPDRNTSRRCPGGLANRVEVEHPNGFVTRYGHLKKGSISVEPGQIVVAGEKIGVMGSSGSSDGPHLHLELRNAEGEILDPFKEGYWINPPEYRPPFSIMDFSVQTGKTDLCKSRTPPAKNVESIYIDEPVTVGLFLSGWRASEEIQIALSVDRQELARGPMVKEKVENFMIVSANIDLPDHPGMYTISLYRDAEPVRIHRLEVQSRAEQ